MAHVFDAAAGGFRLVCEATGVLSPVVATEERAVLGLEWYCDDPAAKEVYLARQRARLKAAIVGTPHSIEKAIELRFIPEDALSRPLTAEERAAIIITAEMAEDIAAALRWDLMPDGSVAGTPSAAKIAEAEAAHPALTQRARLGITSDKPTFASDGIEVATVTITGLIAPATVDLGDGLTAQVSPADPVVRLTSDIPKKFSVRIVDANHWSRPVEVEAV